MTNEPIPSLAEALAEIRRMGQRIRELETIIAENSAAVARDAAAAACSERSAAVTLGTLAAPTEDEPPLVFVRHVPPNAPPHDEQP